MEYNPKLIALDPTDCRCTECLIGEYLPINSADDDQLALMVAGVISNNADAAVAYQPDKTLYAVTFHGYNRDSSWEPKNPWDERPLVKKTVELPAQLVRLAHGLHANYRQHIELGYHIDTIEIDS